MTDTLIARLESADGPSRELFEAAFDAAFPMPRLEDEPEWAGPGTLREPLYHAWYVRKESIQAKLDAEAWTSAAEMLVPEGWTYEGRQGPSAFPHMWTLSTIKCGDVRYTTATGRARFAALALAAAALKARGV